MPPRAAVFARDVIAKTAPEGRERAKSLLWAAGKLADYGLGLGLEAVPEVLLHPFTVDGLIWAASMVVLDASRRNHPVPLLARWSLAAGIVATIGANLAHGLNHGPIGALVSAWPALALVGSFELLMLLVRTHQRAGCDESDAVTASQSAQPADQAEPSGASAVISLEQMVRTWHAEGRSQRAIARDLAMDRRKVKQIIDRAAAA